MSPTHQNLSNDTTFSQIKSRVPVPLRLLRKTIRIPPRVTSIKTITQNNMIQWKLKSLQSHWPAKNDPSLLLVDQTYSFVQSGAEQLGVREREADAPRPQHGLGQQSVLDCLPGNIDNIKD